MGFSRELSADLRGGREEEHRIRSERIDNDVTRCGTRWEDGDKKLPNRAMHHADQHAPSVLAIMARQLRVRAFGA